ncbi:hypothetical protein ATN84_19505 [Paramesorhizobium deserti]|uniref:SGNH hydrolase-type esterase domain-containing protein n=1 Tax=Paramesorhizobium deserti TaxID=1494590 RepID=A0A135HQH4_9HYPH|nr:SGNH/GDSL hydrolase family protein [Paramesorhizobium deserti]KXF75448.1 hypothetical protein ATN84_19505 [Paramesorhizobium deserti]
MVKMSSTRNLLIPIFISVALIIGAEISLRLILGLGNPPLFESDPEIGYLMVANQDVYRRGGRIKINAFHQRSNDLPLHPADGVTRILFLGDSITFGVTGVDQTQIFSELVGSTLRRSGQNVEVMNASAVSWGIGNEFAYVRRFGTFGSKISVLQIGSADLLQPTSTGDGVGVNAGQPSQKPFSAIGELFERVLIPRLMIFMGLEDQGNEPAPSDRDWQFQQNMQHFANLIATIRRQNSLPLVVIMPTLFEMTSEIDPELQLYAPYRSRFQRYLQQLAVPFIDVWEPWLRDPNVDSYYTDGTHLTAAGNRALSKEIVAAINRL